MKLKKMSPKASASLAKVVEAFKTGAISQVVKHAVNPRLDVPCMRWSFSNRVLTALSGTDDARGIKQWAKVGRSVKGAQDPRQGAVAELAVAAIAGTYGRDYTGNAWAYLRSYSGSESPLDLCLSVLSETERVLGEIFQHVAQAESQAA